MRHLGKRPIKPTASKAHPKACAHVGQQHALGFSTATCLAATGLALALAMPLASCSLVGDIADKLTEGGSTMGSRFYMPDDEIVDEPFVALLAAIEAGDRDAVKALFSKKALAGAKDLDAGIDYLFGLVRGDVVSWERRVWTSGESYHYGKHSGNTEAAYDIVTTEGAYVINLINYYTDTIDPDNQGVYTMYAVRRVDELPKLRQVPTEVLNAPGIYIPQDNGEGEVADARFAELAAALQAGDREGVRALFSDTALAEAEDMDLGLDYVFSLVEGGILSYGRMTCGSSEVSKSYGESRCVYSWHSVTTPQGSFIFYLLDYDSDTIDPGNVGLRTLWAIEAEDANDGFYGVTARGGIIVPFSYISGRGGADGAA